MYDGFSRGRFSRRLAQLSRQLLTKRPVNALLKSARALVSAPAATPFAQRSAGGVIAVADFGSNPGALRMRLHVPVAPPLPGAPLLVLLHGCGQDAANFAAASGFVALADRLGAALLLPEQAGANNPGRCFNWFRPKDFQAGTGEAESIRQMVATAIERFEADPARVFIAGLSAGGAMAAAVLAAYPDAFAGGAVVAGLPVGAATSVSSALARMGRAEPAPALAGAPGAAGWPRLSVWHGTADRTVDPANSPALVAQWTARLGLPATPDAEDTPAPGVRRRRWGGAVEQWTLEGLGHGFPALSQAPTHPYVLHAPVQAADAIARFWGLEAA